MAEEFMMAVGRPVAYWALADTAPKDGSVFMAGECAPYGVFKYLAYWDVKEERFRPYDDTLEEVAFDVWHPLPESIMPPEIRERFYGEKA